MENKEQVKEITKTAEQKYNKSAVVGLVLSIISVFVVKKLNAAWTFKMTSMW